MTTNITVMDVAKKVVELADANPNFIYRPERRGGDVLGCRYVHRDETTGQPTGEGCIVGQALVALGVNPDAIREGIAADAVLRHLGIAWGFDGATEAIGSAQNLQDQGFRWGTATADLREMLEREAMFA